MREIPPYRPTFHLLSPMEERDVPLQDEGTENFHDYWIVILRYRWTIATFTLCIALIAGLCVLGADAVYTATATLHLDSQSPNVTGVPEMFGLGVTNLDHFYQTQLHLLQSRSLAARVIRELDLGQARRLETHATDPLSWIQSHVRQGVTSGAGWVQETSPMKWLQQRVKGADEAGGNDEKKKRRGIFEFGVSPDLIDRYLQWLSVTHIRDSQLITVSFRSGDPFVSKEIVNAHVSGFIRASLLTRFELTEEARQFLQGKLTELKVELERSEEDLNRFRKAHAVAALEKGENLLLDRLKGLNADFTQTRSRRIELESLYRSVQRRDNWLLSQIIDNPLIRQMKDQISALEMEKARLTTIFKATHPDVTALQERIDQATNRMDQEVRRIVRSVELDYNAARGREKALADEIEQQRQSALDLQEKAIAAAVLEREAESNRLLYENVLKKTKETDLTQAVPISNIRVVDRADIPLYPDDAHSGRTLGLSVLVGLLGGVGLAFLQYHLDKSLKTPEDITRFLQLPTLGIVPDIRRLDRQVGALGYSRKVYPLQEALQGLPEAGTGLAISSHPFSLVNESYQTICTALLFSLPERRPKTILITSAQPREGKTATAVSLAVTFAQNGAPVLLIDADLRNGHCHRLLGMENNGGLTNVLAGEREATEVIKTTAIANLSLLPRGQIPPNPAPLLGSDRMRQMLDSLQSEFSFIIIDSAPLLPISDTVLLSTKVDGVVLVVKGQEVSRQVVLQACKRLAYVKARVLGVVLNSIDIRSPEYKDYRSSYVSYSTNYPVNT